MFSLQTHDKQERPHAGATDMDSITTPSDPLKIITLGQVEEEEQDEKEDENEEGEYK